MDAIELYVRLCEEVGRKALLSCVTPQVFNSFLDFCETGGYVAGSYDSPPAPSHPRKLYRRANDRVLAGVCGGFADYFDIDTTLIRVLWVILSLFYFIGVIAYIVLALVIPVEPVVDVERSPGGSGGLGLS